jgi:hypothetical protein
MQQRLVVHDFGHLRAKLERGHDAVVLNPDGSACVQCALLATGSGVVRADEVDSALVAQATPPIVLPCEHPLAKVSPASYRSRAPPSFV